MNFTQVNAIHLVLSAIFFAVIGEPKIAIGCFAGSVLVLATGNLIGYLNSKDTKR